jgi:hypothetical protein
MISGQRRWVRAPQRAGGRDTGLPSTSWCTAPKTSGPTSRGLVARNGFQSTDETSDSRIASARRRARSGQANPTRVRHVAVRSTAVYPAIRAVAPQGRDSTGSECPVGATHVGARLDTRRSRREQPATTALAVTPMCPAAARPPHRSGRTPATAPDPPLLHPTRRVAKRARLCGVAEVSINLLGCARGGAVVRRGAFRRPATSRCSRTGRTAPGS